MNKNICINFRGPLEPRAICHAGIRYEEVGNEGHFPCFAASNRVGDCTHFRLPTDKEIEANEAILRAALAEFWRKLSNHICPRCEEHYVSEEKIGHSMYARPCGHRLYQIWGGGRRRSI
jgi:hypothetical protein